MLHSGVRFNDNHLMYPSTTRYMPGSCYTGRMKPRVRLICNIPVVGYRSVDYPISSFDDIASSIAGDSDDTLAILFTKPSTQQTTHHKKKASSNCCLKPENFIGKKQCQGHNHFIKCIGNSQAQHRHNSFMSNIQPCANMGQASDTRRATFGKNLETSPENKGDRCENGTSRNESKIWMITVSGYWDFSPNEIKVRLNDGKVEISAVHEESRGPGPCLSRYEIRQAFAVPADVDHQHISCLKLPNGALLLYAPRAPMSSPPSKSEGQPSSIIHTGDLDRESGNTERQPDSVIYSSDLDKESGNSEGQPSSVTHCSDLDKESDISEGQPSSVAHCSDLDKESDISEGQPSSVAHCSDFDKESDSSEGQPSSVTHCSDLDREQVEEGTFPIQADSLTSEIYIKDENSLEAADSCQHVTEFNDRKTDCGAEVNVHSSNLDNSDVYEAESCDKGEIAIEWKTQHKDLRNPESDPFSLKEIDLLELSRTDSHLQETRADSHDNEIYQNPGDEDDHLGKKEADEEELSDPEETCIMHVIDKSNSNLDLELVRQLFDTSDVSNHTDKDDAVCHDTRTDEKSAEVPVPVDNLADSVKPDGFEHFPSHLTTDTDPTWPIKKCTEMTGENTTAKASPTETAHTELSGKPYYTCLHLQNFHPENIRVKLKENNLFITAEKQVQKKTVVCIDKQQRRLELPDHLDMTSVKCLFQEGGLLVITAQPKCKHRA